MEARLEARCAASIKRKRKRDQISEAMDVLCSATLQDLTGGDFSRSNEVLALLCVKFRWKTVFVLGRLLSNLPHVISSNIDKQILEGSFPELEKMVSPEETKAIIDALRKCQDFIKFSYEQSVVSIAEKAGIPLHHILFPPITICFTCGWSL